MSKISITAIIILILGLGALIYFISQGPSTEELLKKRDSLQGNLAAAQNKLNNSKNSLEAMKKDAARDYAAAVALEDDVKKTTSLVADTDFIFIDAYSANPELAFNYSITDTAILRQRALINSLLLKWQSKSALANVGSLGSADRLQIKEDTQAIKKYLEDLWKIVEDLNPRNSGLTQSQIDSFIEQLPSQEVAAEVLASFVAAVENLGNINSQKESGTFSVSTQTGGGSSGGHATVEEIVEQESTVSEEAEEVTIIEQQINQVTEQINNNYHANSSPSAPSTPNAPVEDVTPPPVVDPGIPDTSVPVTPIIIYPRQRTPSEGIIVQPGPPRLIQGTDAY